MKYFDTEIDITEELEIYVLVKYKSCDPDISPDFRVVLYNGATGEEHDCGQWLNARQYDKIRAMVEEQEQLRRLEPIKRGEE